MNQRQFELSQLGLRRELPFQRNAIEQQKVLMRALLLETTRVMNNIQGQRELTNNFPSEPQTLKVKRSQSFAWR